MLGALVGFGLTRALRPGPAPAGRAGPVATWVLDAGARVLAGLGPGGYRRATRPLDGDLRPGPPGPDDPVAAAAGSDGGLWVAWRGHGWAAGRGWVRRLGEEQAPAVLVPAPRALAADDAGGVHVLAAGDAGFELVHLGRSGRRRVLARGGRLDAFAFAPPADPGGGGPTGLLLAAGPEAVRLELGDAPVLRARWRLAAPALALAPGPARSVWRLDALGGGRLVRSDARGRERACGAVDLGGRREGDALLAAAPASGAAWVVAGEHARRFDARCVLRAEGELSGLAGPEALLAGADGGLLAADPGGVLALDTAGSPRWSQGGWREVRALVEAPRTPAGRPW